MVQQVAGGRATTGRAVARRRWPALVAVLVAGLAGLGGGTSTATADVGWLCHPDRPAAQDPCETPQDTTVLRPGAPPVVRTSDRPARERRPIDCFFVYPTVSNQLALNAQPTPDPEILDIAKWQASPYSRLCRMFAPTYAQSTVLGIAGNVLPPTSERAYADVLAAWRQYLAKDNGGRGILLLGHSQGTLMLRQLLRKEIEPRAELRARLVGGALMGGNVTTAKGQDVGGDFRHVPVCTTRGQAGCIVAYSTYGTDPAPITGFGNVDANLLAGGFGFPQGAGYEVACTDPARLSGMPGPMTLRLPSKPYAPGFIGALILVTAGGSLPTAATTWVESERYAGSCRWINNAHVLRFEPVGGSRRFLQDPVIGGHLLDLNLGVEKLQRIADLQTAAWLRERVAARAVARGRAVEVAVPAGGTVELVRAKILRTRRSTVEGPGTVRLAVTRAKRRAARRWRTVSARVTFRPAVGEPVVRTVRVRVR